MYSGPRRPSDGLGTFLKDHGVETTYVDKEFTEMHDLLDQDVWERIEKTLDEFDGYVMSPPCSTQALRSTSGPKA